MTTSSRTLLFLTCSAAILLSSCGNHNMSKQSSQGPLRFTEAAKPDSALNEKISRLEQQVAELQREATANRPQIAKISVIEQKFKDVSLGLERIDATYSIKPVEPPKPRNAPEPAHRIVKPVAEPAAASAPISLPVPKAELQPDTMPEPIPAPAPVVAAAAPIALTPPPPKPVEKKAPAAAEKPVKATGAKEVLNLRVGEQKGYTRMVLDLGQPVKVTTDIDNGEKILLIEIPGFAWKAAETRNFANSPLVQSYQASSDANGTQLVVQLKKDAKVLNVGSLNATAGKSPRAVVDIAAQ